MRTDANLKEFMTKLKDPAVKVKQAHAVVGSVSFTTCTLLTSRLEVKNIVAAYRGTPILKAAQVTAQ